MVTPRLVGKRHRAKTTVIVPRSEFEVYARKAAAKVLDLIEGGTARVKAADFAQVLMKMYDGEEVEVSLNRGTDRTLLLEGAVALPTLSALKLRTDEIMREHDWDAIVCTAKTGQWLFDYSDVIRQRKRKLALVVADTTFASNLRSRLAQSLKPGIRWLPWWLQNRHVTVYLKDNEPRLAFSFERRLRTATITPLELCGKDVHAAWDTFVAYWVRADRFKHGLSDDYIPDTVIELTRKSLLRKLAPPRKTRRKRTA
jgi:hypothetical protein